MKFLLLFSFFYTVFLFSCAGNKNTVYQPVPDSEYSPPELKIETGSISETRDGSAYLPAWLRAYLSGGIEEAEKIAAYQNKYVFIGYNEGINLSALNKWADNYAAALDFPVLAAARIEKKMLTAASLYPDDEYGIFFERMMLSSYNAEYPGVVKTDDYWIRLITNQEIYMYFILLTIDKEALQSVIEKMIAEAAASPATNAQKNAINRLRQNFFEDF